MVRGVMLLSVCIAAIAASPAAAGAQSQQQGTVEISVKSTVEKLGLKPSGNLPDEFDLGRSITVSLADPAKAAKYGIVGMHEGGAGDDDTSRAGPNPRRGRRDGAAAEQVDRDPQGRVGRLHDSSARANEAARPLRDL